MLYVGLFVDFRHYLMDPELRLIRPVSVVLQSVALGSWEASRVVANNVVPSIMELLQKTILVSEGGREGERKMILHISVPVLQ